MVVGRSNKKIVSPKVWRQANRSFSLVDVPFSLFPWFVGSEKKMKYSCRRLKVENAASLPYYANSNYTGECVCRNRVEAKIQ